jgi:hypothetical protein
MEVYGRFAYSIALPVYTARRHPDERFEVIGEIVGTCFSIGNRYMMTAGHVIEKFRQRSDLMGVVGVFEPELEVQKGAEITDYEILPCDLGVLRVEFMEKIWSNWFHTLKWLQKPLNQFDKVTSLGYAYGLCEVEDRKSVLERGFEGHIVAAPKEFKPQNYQGKPFSVYELSFQSPRGLSGAPLLSLDPVHVTGVLIGNSKTSMLVFDSAEVEKSPTSETVVERYESLSLGIAVQARKIFDIKSALLDNTLGEHFRENGMLK